MSLFKTREWWSTTCGNGEEFDHGCMAIGNVDEALDGGVKIVTGSFSGVIRVHAPKDIDYKVDDLVLEADLKLPMIQVEVGRFVSHTGRTSIAVLHPRKLAVYTLDTKGAASTCHQLSLDYEHRLEHTACNMIFGQFGGAHTDYICVQSMDGQLSVFEQETLAFARYLPNFLIPGPLVYCRQNDSFLTCNSCFELECYKYQVLASSSADRLRDGEKSESGGLTAKKKVQVDWKLCLGEAAIQIVTTTNFSAGAAEGSGAGQRPGSGGPASTTSSRVDIVVLAERTLFVLSEAGHIKSQKKLEYLPTVCHAFPVRPEMGDHSPTHLLVADSTGSVMVYHGMHLLWASKCEVPPVALSIVKVGTVGGILVGLADDGSLGVSYMGTEPPVNVVGGYEGKELDYEEMDDEHRRLLGIIRESMAETKAEPVDVVQIRVQVPTHLDGAG
eukprot:CAMPEP_0197575954 /NCGR_PEP_ID=MMETSP1326-20131121/1147_1 /TAXON_ID=1155430 /ORGANISM="Genus nov. species nov., Strain RCC2288" /LENGTH=442 /DNA_ID=CAMNT_0043138795 /DNA_START=95 /DNA_END=1420 /DNA_ORIENTATION=-